MTATTTTKTPPLSQPLTAHLLAAVSSGRVPQAYAGDYSNVLWVTGSQARAQQVERGLQRELLVRGGGAILPPRVLPWHRAASILALLHLYDHPEPALAVQWPELWLEQALLPVAAAVLDDDPAAALNADALAARRRNLAADFRTFVGRVVLLDRADALDTLAATMATASTSSTTTTLSTTARWFVRAWQAYATAAAQTADVAPYSALEALRQLVKKAETQTIASPLALILEHSAEPEPLVQRLFDRIRFADVLKISGGGPPPTTTANATTTTTATVPPPSRRVQLRRMMTSLDEAEATALLVRRQLELRASRPLNDDADDVVVVCVDEGLRRLLSLTFDRMGILASRTVPLGNLAEYRLLQAALRVLPAPGGVDGVDDAQTAAAAGTASAGGAAVVGSDLRARTGRDLFFLLTEPSSRFCLSDVGASRAVRALQKRWGSAPVHSVITAKNGFAADDIDRAARLAQFLQQDLSLQQRARDLILVRTGREAAVHGLFDQCGQIDRHAVDADNASRMLASANAHEVADPAGASSTGHFVPVVRPREALTLDADVVIVCGLDARFDDARASCAPLPLLKAIEVPGGRALQQADARALRTIFETAATLHVSHAWLDDAGKVKGQSLLLHELVDGGFGPVDVRPLPGQGLLTLEDVVGETAAATASASPATPAPSTPSPRPAGSSSLPVLPLTTASSATATAVPDRSLAPTGPLLTFSPPSWLHGWLDQRLIDLLRAQRGTVEGTNTLKVRVTELSAFAACPRQFALHVVSNALALDTVDADAQQRMDRGVLWHSIFERAGQAPEFVSRDLAKVTACLQRAAQDVIAREKDRVDGLFSGGVEAFQNEAVRVVLPRFAAREIERQKVIDTRKVLVEQAYSCQLPSTRSQGFAWRLDARVDRIDVDGDGRAHVWDYKLGGSSRRALTIVMKKKKGSVASTFRRQEPRYMSQLALYLHLIDAAGLDVGDKSIGGLINLDGTDSVHHAAREKDTIAYSNTVKATLSLLFDDFDEKAHRPLRELLFDPGAIDSRATRAGNAPAKGSYACKHCSYVAFCRVPTEAKNTTTTTQDVDAAGGDDA
jgi:hypothetical protein